MKRWILVLALGLVACSPRPFAAFVVNQDAHSQAHPGKSYSAEPCSLRVEAGMVHLLSGVPGTPSALDLRVPLPDGKTLDGVLGQTLSGGTGKVLVEGRDLKLESGTFTLQTFSGGVARGNFNARVAGQNPPWEVVGSFDATSP